MFRIGEFSKVAQVSGRLLRYYDEIGLLHPVHTDESGYRFYSAKQLPRLNRILALKELGLSLDQIKRMLDDDISADEIRGMLMMRKAQIEQTLREEMTRFKVVEARIDEINSEGNITNDDVVIKSVPTQRFLALRETFKSLGDARTLFSEINKALPAKVNSRSLGYFTVVVHSEYFEEDSWDLEIGWLVNEQVQTEVTVPGDRLMTIRELPAHETLVTAVRIGPPQINFGSYLSLGRWAEMNNYRIIGPGREVFLEYPQNPADAVAEIQFPVEPVISQDTFLPDL